MICESISFFRLTLTSHSLSYPITNRMNTELQKLQQYREQVMIDNQKYLDDHPELSSLIDQFVAAVITQKPTDLVKFGQFFFNNLRSSGGSGPCPIVIAGPSGVGKGTLINKLLAKFPSVFGFSVSHTTRPPRSGEVDGVHYNFVSKEEFEDAVERGDFVEYAKVHTNYYGTSFQAIEKVRINLFRFDLLYDCLFYFLDSCSRKDLHFRYRYPRSTKCKEVKVRLQICFHLSTKYKRIRTSFTWSWY
jgi:hypothetical protein